MLTDLAQIQASATADASKVGAKRSPKNNQTGGPLETSKMTMTATAQTPVTGKFEDDTAKKLAAKKARQNANK